MSRLELPLLSKKVWATGDLVLRAELDLLIRDEHGTWKPVTFRVDSGTEMTSMAAARARALDLPIPRLPVLLDVSGVRREVRAGFLRAQVVGMNGTEHLFPGFFLGSPEVTPDSIRSPVMARNLLGLTGVVDKLRIQFDGTPSPGARHGIMVAEKLGRHSNLAVGRAMTIGSRPVVPGQARAAQRRVARPGDDHRIPTGGAEDSEGRPDLPTVRRPTVNKARCAGFPPRPERSPPTSAAS